MIEPRTYYENFAGVGLSIYGVNLFHNNRDPRDMRAADIERFSPTWRLKQRCRQYPDAIVVCYLMPVEARVEGRLAGARCGPGQTIEAMSDNALALGVPTLAMLPCG